VELDLSTRELECQQLHFPCDKILDDSQWLQDLFQFNPEGMEQFLKFKQKIIGAFVAYQIPIIELKKETSKEAVCLVFEKVNTGGVQLSVFELMTATYAAEGYNLQDDWFGSEIRNVASRRERLAKHELLKDVESTDFLQAITLLHTRERKYQDISGGKQGKQVRPVSAKRASVLELPSPPTRHGPIKLKPVLLRRPNSWPVSVSSAAESCLTALNWCLWPRP